MIRRRQVPAPAVVPSAARSRIRQPRRLHRAFAHLIVALLAVDAVSAPAYGTTVPTPGYPTLDPNP